MSVYLYCPNLRQKIRLNTKLKFLFFAVYARNPALKVPGYLILIVGSQVVQHIFANIFLGYNLTNSFTLDDAVPGKDDQKPKNRPYQLPKTVKRKMSWTTFWTYLSALSNFRNFGARFLPYKAKIKNSNLLLIFYFGHWF